MIKGNEAIAQALTVFHDGGIDKTKSDPDCFTIFVNIQYLTRRIDENFRGFSVRFCHDLRVSFQAWESEGILPAKIDGLNSVVALDLEILQAEVQKDCVVIMCLSHSGDFTSQGGEMNVATSGIEIRDEAGSEYGVGDLKKLSSEYWKDWDDKNQSKDRLVQ